MDVAKVQALGTVLIGLAILQRTDKTFVNREILAVKELIEREAGINDKQK